MSSRALFVAMAAVLLAACNKPSDPVVPPQPMPETTVVPALMPKAEAAAATKPVQGGAIVGGDQDAHGCKPSAGYTWSQVQEKCLRIFEAGKKLNPVMEGARADGAVAYVVFDKAQSRAEVFLPGEQAAIILEEHGREGEQVWEAGEYRLIPWKGLVLQKNGQAIYGGE